MRVKICGITNFQDAIQAIDAGADALGFVFYEKSPRYIAPKDALEIVQKLPPFIERVGLFVNSTSEFINSTCMKTKMSTAQVHFEANKALFDRLPDAMKESQPHLELNYQNVPFGDYFVKFLAAL